MKRRYSTRRSIRANRHTSRRNILCNSRNSQYGYVGRDGMKPYLGRSDVLWFRDYYEGNLDSRYYHEMRDMDGLVLYNDNVYSAYDIESYAWNDYESLSADDPDIIGGRDFDEFLADELDDILYDVSPEARVIDSDGYYTVWEWL